MDIRDLTDLLVAAQGSGTAGAVHRVEGVLKRRYQRAFAGRKGDEEITGVRTSNDTHRPGNSERDAREADESLDATGEPLGGDLSSGAADLLNLVARRTQTAAAFQGSFCGRIGRCR